MSASIARFLASLSNSGIASHDEAESFAAEIPPDQRGQDADAFARELVRQGKLTRYQAAAVYQDKTDGLLLGNYLVLDKLGAGGMGQVFRARHRRMERVVALKVLPKKALSAPDAIARFQREAQAAAKLTHPNIVTAHDFDEANGQHFLVMEYVEGSDLASQVKQHGALSVAQALDCILQAARGLEHAHAEGVVHRDIKPSNLLVDKKGTLKILDMGLARISDPLADPTAAPGADLTQSGSIMGTIDYMAPEQAMDSRQADARSDIYSLGCTLHYLLTGRPPYGGDTVLKRLTAHQQSAIPLLSSTRPDIPPGLDEVFARMMAKRPAARFQTAKELIAALEALRNRPASSRPVPVAAQPIPVPPSAAQPSTAQPLVAQPAAVPVASISSTSGMSGLEGIVPPGTERASRSGHKPRSKAPLVVAAVVLLLAAAGAGAWMVSGNQLDETVQGQPPPSAKVQPSAASPSPVAIAKAKPAADPPQEPAQAAAPMAAAQSPPKVMPPEIEPPANAAPQVTLPVAAPVVPAVVSAKTVPASPPVASPPVASPPVASPPVAPSPVTVAAAPLPAEQPAAADGKLPIPSVEGQREALKLIKELYKDEYAQAKQPEAKAALAEKLLNESQQTKDDATALYCVLQEARELAVEAASPALAERAIGMLAGRFAVEPLKELAASLDAMTDKPHPAAANHKIAEMALGRIEEALAADEFDTAKQLADTALAAGRKAKDAALIKRVVEVGKTVTAAKQQWDGWHKAQATLAKTPDDPAANLTVGRYFALVQGDWEQGFAHLANGPDGPLKDLALKGLKPPTEPAALAELGDAWFTAADKAKGKDKADLRAGAAYWYSAAEPGLTGLAKTIVEKRLKELGGKVAVARPGSAGKMPETVELLLAPGVGIKFRLIPAGTFTMGRAGDTGAEFAHQVRITRAFYIGITEVTQAQWFAVMGSNPGSNKGPNFPVQDVSWDTCQSFLAHLNRLPASRNFVFRLPTEAEWEYACRAGTTTNYSFGDDEALVPNFGWISFKGNAPDALHPTAQLKPSPWGLFDIHGGVWEWCSDWYGKDYYRQSPVDDPQGPAAGTLRVIRGGGYWNDPSWARSARRNSISPEISTQNYGLRVVCEPKVKAATATRAAGQRPGGPMTSAPRSHASGGTRPLAFNQADVERSVANWVLSLGGKVKVTSPATPEQNPVEITAAAQLPAEPFVLYGIDLFENKSVTDDDLARISGLLNLVELKLTGTAVGDDGMSHIGQMRRLTLLYLHGTKVTDAGLAELDHLVNLTHLFLTGTRTTDAGFVHLRPLTEMRHVGLQNTGLTDAGIKNLAGMKHLRWLAISRTKITDTALKDLTRNPEITYIELVSTQISDAGLAALRSMPMLSGLNLDQTPVDDRALEVLAMLSALKSVHVTGSHVTDAGVQRFRAQRPDCEIVR